MIGTANRESNRCLEQVSVTGQYAIKVVSGEPYLVGVDGVGSTGFFGMVVVISFVLTICFFVVGISSSVVIPGIGGAILVDSRSK